jgi:A/G-specific adenine glycosylase
MQILAHSKWIESPDKVSAYQMSLLQWYKDNQRDLPWRSQPSLYKTVVSEFMLQQTRVVTALPYFENWMKKFPDFESLANAKEDRVLKAWEGLGYYSRARNLHKLSKIAASWEPPPKSVNEWIKLPGVGPYIAAAVTSISFGLPIAVCDGNVVRVITRLLEINEAFKDGAIAQNKIRPIAQKLICPDHSGDYNQAIMELGATVCHRSNPLCTTCPVIAFCKAGQNGNWSKYPAISRKPKKTKEVIRLWVEQEEQLLLHSSSDGRLTGIYELPRELPFAVEFSQGNQDEIAVRRRTIGNVEYTEKIFRTNFTKPLDQSLPDGWKWMKWSEMDKVTLSGPHRKWITELMK